MTTTNSTYHIKESEIAYVIDALDSAFMYLEQNCDGMSSEALWESMGIMHNLRRADSGELYWTPWNYQLKTEKEGLLDQIKKYDSRGNPRSKVTDVGDTDYFD